MHFCFFVMLGSCDFLVTTLRSGRKFKTTKKHEYKRTDHEHTNLMTQV